MAVRYVHKYTLECGLIINFRWILAGRQQNRLTGLIYFLPMQAIHSLYWLEYEWNFGCNKIYHVRTYH